MNAPTIDPRILELLTASYARRATELGADDDEVISTTVSVSMSPKPSRKASSKASAGKTIDDAATVCGKSHDARPAPQVAPLAKVGTIDAKEFFRALRNAKSREESIQAIAAFTGYDRSKDFGAQELAARTEATRQLKANVVPTVSATIGEHVVRTSHPSTVAGMIVSSHGVALPDHTAKRLADLEAKERQVAESIADHEGAACNGELDLAERHYHQELAKVERARIMTIREDIANLRNARR